MRSGDIDRLSDSIEQREKGIYLLEESGKLYNSANEAEDLFEFLELTKIALDKDLEALSLIWEATISQKRILEDLGDSFMDDLPKLKSEIQKLNM